MPWQRWRFKGNKVYAEVSEKGRLRVIDGKVRVRYKLDDTRTYRVNAGNLVSLPPDQGGDRLWSDAEAAPLEDPSGHGETRPPASADRASAPRPSPAPGAVGERPPSLVGEDDRHLLNDKPPIVIFTDGSCRGNPGPAGIGVVLTCAGKRKELSEYIGYGTNNVAELTAILRGLEQVKDRQRTVVLYTDSAYAIGVLQGWKVRANAELIQRIQRLRRRFPDLRIRKVPGHAGNVENERCDQLAREAISRHVVEPLEPSSVPPRDPS